MNRTATVERLTSETQVRIRLNLDGTGQGRIKTPLPFLDHMLTLMTRHGFLDLSLSANGDVEVDDHHTVEDIGLVLGDAMQKALGKKQGIRRYGFSSIPMDETLASVTLDLSGRPYLVYHVKVPGRTKIKEFDISLVEDFFQAFVNRSGTTLHINVAYGKNPHHILESVFKAFGKALSQAVAKDERVQGALSTKGRLG
ncbi:MAG TPA: imidazoleglycerol-phosphate dehydratase HisB [Nitrospiria bacterium]|nr:imidazoleglycerol-phosphate dehydratase HisB [Nitrospiria bacterium]